MKPYTLIQLFSKSGTPVTEKLVLISDNRLVCHCDGIDLMPTGSIADNAENDVLGYLVRRYEYVVNIKDLINVDVRRDITHGCCGPDGDVLNIFDTDGNPIGYEHSDCYQSPFVEIPKENVNVVISEVQSVCYLFALSYYKRAKVIVERAVGIDYDSTLKKLEGLIYERLAHELIEPLIYPVLAGIHYKELAEITDFLNVEKTDYLWLYTKEGK